ncbi:MAG: T9SS type A sorting domain-containing protein [Bacteroidales bacterium]|nr:T9SS type A sorting domain-containing protein [Bacteroidales bacterium]
MKTTISILTISILIIAGCYAQQKNKLSANELTDSTILDFYLQYSEFTDPGEYDYLYKNLPDSLPELCSLIKSLFIHPYVELPRYKNLIPEERWDEYLRFPSVKSILEGLLSYDSSDLVNTREPENRLVMGCQQNAILLASILKYQGIPARVRSGHATYLIPNFHASHTICEVWNENEKRWMLVDPSTDQVDFSSNLFDYSNEAWLQLQNEEVNPELFGNPGQYTGLISIAGKIPHDLAAVLGTEYPITQYAPILDYVFDNNQLTSEQIELLDTISELMKSLNAENLMKLHEIYNNTPEIQITKSFEVDTTSSLEDDTTNSEVNTGVVETSVLNDYNLSQNYPNPFQFNTNIKFSIPGEGKVILTIFDMAGKTVKSLIDEKLSEGSYSVKFDANNFPSGVYFYSLEVGNFRQIKKMILSQ